MAELDAALVNYLTDKYSGEGNGQDENMEDADNLPDRYKWTLYKPNFRPVLTFFWLEIFSEFLLLGLSDPFSLISLSQEALNNPYKGSKDFIWLWFKYLTKTLSLLLAHQ